MGAASCGKRNRAGRSEIQSIKSLATASTRPNSLRMVAKLWVAADDQSLTRIDIATRQVVSRLNHNGLVTKLSTAPDGRFAVTVSELTSYSGSTTTATLWNMATQEQTILDQTQQRGRAPQGRITSAQFDPSGAFVAVSRAATSQAPARVQIWNVNDAPGVGRLVSTTAVSATAQASVNRRARHAVRLPAVLGTAEMILPIDGDSLITMNKNGAFRWNLNTHRLIRSYRAHASLTEASFSFDSRRIATASRSVKIWDAQSGAALGKLDGPHIGPVRTVQFAPAAVGATQFVLATGGDDGIVRIWSWNDTTGEFKQLHEYQAAADGGVIRRVRFSPDAAKLLIVGDRGTAKLWTPETGATVDLGDLEAGGFTCGAFSADGAYVVVGGTDRRLRCWKIPANGQPPGKPTLFSGHADIIHDVRIIGNSSPGFPRVISVG